MQWNKHETYQIVKANLSNKLNSSDIKQVNEVNEQIRSKETHQTHSWTRNNKNMDKLNNQSSYIILCKFYYRVLVYEYNC